MNRKIRKLIIRTGFILGAFFYFNLVMLTIIYLGEGNYFGHMNHYGQPVGTMLLVVVLTLIPVVYITWLIKNIINKRKK